MNSKSVDHNIAHKEQVPPVSQIQRDGGMWGDAASTWYSCELGDGGMEGGRGVGEVGEQGGREERRGGEGRLSGLRSASHAGSASSRRCCCRCCWRGHRGIIHASIYSPRDITNSADVATWAREPRRHPPSLWIHNRRHLTVRRGARRGAGRPPASAEGRLLTHENVRHLAETSTAGSPRDLFSHPASG